MTRATPRPLLAALVLAALVPALGACQISRHGDNLEGRASDRWTRSYPLAPAGEFQIVNVNGDVEVHGGNGSTIEVAAERSVKASTDAAAREILPRIEIREDVAPDKVALQTIGLAGIVIGVDIRVDYHVTVPAGAALRIRTTNGGISASGTTGRVVLSTVNGKITGAALGGGVDARVVNGTLEIDMAALRSDPVELRSTNGSVNLSLPADANAFVLANVTNGKIDVADLKLELSGEQTPRRLRGRLNAGGTPVEVTTVNGNLRIHSRQ